MWTTVQAQNQGEHMFFFRMSLTLQMLIATVLGITCGLFFGELCKIFAPWSDAYIMLLKITAVPYLICAIMHGVGQLSVTQALQILKKGALFIGIVIAINLGAIYLTKFAFPTPKGTQLGGYVLSEVPPINIPSLLIPDNIFNALASNTVPAVVVFSLLVGISLLLIKEKQTMMQMFQNFVDVLTRITGWIARITPIGTFIIIANQVGTIQFSTIKQMSTYIILYILVTCLIVFWIFPRFASTLSNLRTYQWLNQLFPILLLAYTTNVVIVTLPYIIEILKKETMHLEPRDEKAQTQIQGTVSIVFNIPLGSTFITIFVFFIALFYNFHLAAAGQLKLFLTTFLTSLGAVGLGSWINSLTFILDTLGLPIESVNLYLTTLPFTAGFQSMVSAMEIATLSFLITLACRKHLVIQYRKLLQRTAFTILPVLLVFSGIKLFNPLPEIKSETKSIYELSIHSHVKVKVYSQQEKEALPKQSILQDTFDHIAHTKTIRIGYNPTAAPFCFYNLDDQVVGYDIAFAYELAYDLGCSLEFIPIDYAHLSEELEGGLYDIAMSAVSITELRLRKIAFTKSYLQPRLVFVTNEKNKKIFSSLETIYSLPNLKVAVLKGSSFESFAHEFFPEKQIVYINSYEEFPLADADALLWEEYEAITWTLCHRGFRIAIPKPHLGMDILGYGIRSNSPHFLAYLNQWLALKKDQGYTQKQFDLWILGKTNIVAIEEPRWSIIRNVLHWTD